nr:hypothetical protein [Tanacetum cinerariifolium]
MAPLTFADTHNMVTFLSKSDASLGFDQVVDFLNAQVIQKKVVLTEDVIRQDLRLDDGDGVECLPNEEIFAELARIGGKIKAIDANEDITLVDVETQEEESFKKLKAVEVSGSESTQETLTNHPKEMSEEDVQNMLEIIPVSKFKVEALQV